MKATKYTPSEIIAQNAKAYVKRSQFGTAACFVVMNGGAVKQYMTAKQALTAFAKL